MIATSPDGQWAVVRRGREVMLLAGGAGPATARIELPTDDADLVIVGPPSVLAVVTRGTTDDGVPCHRVVLYQPPYLDAVAQLDLDVAMRLAAVTGPRIVLVSQDGMAVTIVRVAGRALAAQSIEPGSPVEFAVGLERNQVLLGLHRKLEAWDVVSGRPLLRMQLALPPPPRTVGPAHGHVWATRPGGEDIVVCRLSDGRPFRHHVGVAIDEVIHHPASPLLVLATAHGLARLHCFAHALTVIDAPWQPGMSLAQLVVGDDVSLLGIADDQDEPWRVPIGGAGAPPLVFEPAERHAQPAPLRPRPDQADEMTRAVAGAADDPAVDAAADAAAGAALGVVAGMATGAPVAGMATVDAAPEMAVDAAVGAPDEPHAIPERATRELPEIASPRPVPVLRLSERPPPVGSVGPVETVRPAPAPRSPAWRDPLAAFGAELVRAGKAEVPEVGADSELGELAHRLGLPPAARRALAALYALYLIGEPGVPIAWLAQALNDWTEPLGQGELAALAMLDRRGGKVALRGSVTDLLDGAAPRAIRLIGEPATMPRTGISRLARDGRSDAAIEAELTARLGRIAVIEGGASRALLEARLHGATAVALVAPRTRPAPWPRDAALVVVAEPAAPAWVAALPALTAA